LEHNDIFYEVSEDLTGLAEQSNDNNCTFKFHNVQEIDKHISHHKFKCKHCTYTFGEERRLRNHMKTNASNFSSQISEHSIFIMMGNIYI
jgi:transposase-like protein